MILIALGSNLPSRYGSSEQTIAAALACMAGLGLEVVRSSRVWRTQPVPASDQPLFANAVALIKTDLDPQALMALLHAIEVDFGRVRKDLPNVARVLDLDILAYDQVCIDIAGLVVPHPRLHERGFVLYPLHEIAPDWHHPIFHRGMAEMIAALECKTTETVVA